MKANITIKDCGFNKEVSFHYLVSDNKAIANTFTVPKETNDNEIEKIVEGKIKKLKKELSLGKKTLIMEVNDQDE